MIREIMSLVLQRERLQIWSQFNGGIEAMLDPNCKDQDTLALIRYIAEEDKFEKILENPQVIKTPVVRNGKQSTLGYQPDVWKGWVS